MKNEVTLRDLKNKIKILTKLVIEDEEVFGATLAQTLRVMLYDSNQSTSLLNILGLKEVKFLSTNTYDEFASSGVHLGLIRKIKVGVNDGKGGEVRYWPLFDERYFKALMSMDYMDFDNWWSEVVMKFDNYEITRKDLILNVANKDGGAHYNTAISEKYGIFKINDVCGEKLIGMKSLETRGFDNAPVLPSIKQIAYEVLKTFSEYGLLK